MMTLEQIIEKEQTRRTEGGQFGVTACKESIRFYLAHGKSLEEQLDGYVKRANEEVFFNRAMVLACWEMLQEQQAKIDAYFEGIEAAERDALDSITYGQRYAYRAWSNTKEYGAEMFEVTELPWGERMENGGMTEFITTLRDAGVKTFAVTDHSTALMEGLHAIFANGCTMIGPVKVKRQPKWWGDEEHAGLEFKVN